MRATTLDALTADHLTVARSKGLRRDTIVGRHVLPNAILPLVTLLARGFGTPSLLVSALTTVVNLGPLALCAFLLVGGQLLVSPFVASIVATLSGGRLVGTYFGMHALVQGVGATLGNFAGGAAFEVGRASGFAGLAWLLMVVVGAGCAVSMVLLERAGQLGRAPAEALAAVRAGA